MPYTLDLIESKPNKQKGYPKSYDDYDRVLYYMELLDLLIVDHHVSEIYAEIPVGGAQSSAAVKYLAMATALVAHLEVQHSICVRRVTPAQVKEGYLEQKKVKGKEPIIEKALKDHPNLNWPSKRGGGLATTKLEHCADAIAIYYAWRYFNV